MTVFYTCDNNYVWLMGISVISLFENNKSSEHLNVYLLGENISDENKEKLKEIAEDYKRNIFIVDIPKLDIPECMLRSRWPRSAFTRLYAGELLPEDLKYALYLDCDTIINKDIRGIWSYTEKGKTFYGIKDAIASGYKKNIGLGRSDAYINAGVLLIDLDSLRGKNIPSLLEQFTSRYGEKTCYADQDVLNSIFYDEIGYLPPEYDVMTLFSYFTYEEGMTFRRPGNYYTKEQVNKAVADPVIIHYTTLLHVIRPWFTNTNHPYAEVFEKYRKKSPWSEKNSGEKVFTGAKAKLTGMIIRLPKPLSLRILCVLHSFVRPVIAGFIGGMKQKKKTKEFSTKIFYKNCQINKKRNIILP